MHKAVVQHENSSVLNGYSANSWIVCHNLDNTRGTRNHRRVPDLLQQLCMIWHRQLKLSIKWKLFM